MSIIANTVLRKTTLRSADRDFLHVRQRFERALAQVEWSPPELAPAAILLVRRLAVGAAEAAAAEAPFPRRVSLELRRCVRAARRPWLNEDAALAPAVIFADEAELIACLARDWLRGLVAQRWWWRSVLLDASPAAWLRRDVMPCAERLMPAIALLATRAEAAAFVARLEPVDCARALVPVARAYAVPLEVGRVEPVPSPSAAQHTAEHVAPFGAATAKYDLRREAVRRLLQEAPELRHGGLDVAQRRLLALVLALTRAPTWARTPPIAFALEALDDLHIVESGASSEPAAVWTSRRSADVATAEGPEASGEPGSPPTQPHRVNASAIDAPRTIETEPLGASSNPSPETIPQRVEASTRAATLSRVQRHEPGSKPAPITELAAAAPPPFTLDGAANAVDLLLEMPRARSRDAKRYAVVAAPRIATQFGGLFYLLNAALALGVYGDFTTPRSSGLALSPWDWLAMVGRAWFGDELVDDPVWSVLADLAGREEGEEAGRDFEPPSERWFGEHLVMLEARIALAVDVPEGDELRALVCRHEAGIEITAGTVHVFLSLRDLPLSIRLAGLDRDPGWIPAAGRDVRFFFA